MIEPTTDHIGRSVIYRRDGHPVELGVITTYSSEPLLVRYGANFRCAIDTPRIHWNS